MVRSHVWRIGSLLASLTLGMAGCATARHEDSVAAAAKLTQPGELDAAALGYNLHAWQLGDVTVAGQPTQERLERFISDGGTLVVNIRTPQEMADRQRLPLDEEAVVRSNGAEYLFIPLGGQKEEFPFTTKATDEFLAALERHKGQKVLMHCHVGYRASHLWAAALVRSGRATPDTAHALAQKMLFGNIPFEGLSGTKVHFEPVSN